MVQRRGDFADPRAALMRRAQAALAMRQRMQQRAAPTRQGGPPVQAGPVGNRGNMQNAVDFGKHMAGISGGPLDQAVGQIRSDVANRLADKGIYQDAHGTYQIAGLERPNDPGIDIRDSAVKAMGGTSWLDIVHQADAAARSNLGLPSASPRTPSAPSDGGITPATRTAPASGTGLPDYPGRPNASVIYNPSTAGTSTGPVGRGTAVHGAPAPTTPAAGSLGSLAAGPQPGLSAGPMTSPPPPSGQFPPQGQGVGRTTTPTGAQIDPGRYPVTSPAPSLTTVGNQGVGGGNIGENRIGAGTGGQIIGQGPMGQSPAATPPVTRGEYNTSQGGTIPQGRGQPGTGIPSGAYGYQSQPGNLPPGEPVGSTSGGAPSVPQNVGQPIGQGSQTTFMPYQGQRSQTPQPGLGGTPPTTTPARGPITPAQTPNRGAMGTSPGSVNAADLASQIQQQVWSRINGGQGTAGAPTQAGSTTDRLAGLGDRIAQSVLAKTQGIGAQGQGTGGIMDRVMGQLAQRGLGMPMTPTGQGGMPSNRPGGMPAPAGPTSQAPTGTGGTLGSYGNASVDQWDQAFIAAGNKYGIDPTLLKAMMEIESGGNGNLPLTQCRGDGSCGPMQVKPGIWGNVSSVPEQIEQAASILAGGVSSGQYATAEDALFGIYFPTDDVMNGTTQGMYADKVHQLQAQMGPYQPAQQGGVAAPSGMGPPDIDPRLAAVTGTYDPTQGGTATAPPGTPQQNPSQGVIAGPGQTTPGGGVYNTISQPTGNTVPNGQPIGSFDAQGTAWADGLTQGGSQAALSNGYGYGVDQGIGLYGGYGPGWGCATCHPGVDVPTNGSQSYNAMQGGTITCVGGQSALDRGGAVPDGSVSCGSYNDETGGVGNVSVLADNGALLIYGHSHSVNYQLGSTIQAGQPLGMSGSENGYHVHMEVQLPVGPGGSYTPVDPDLYFSGYYCSVGYCPS